MTAESISDRFHADPDEALFRQIERSANERRKASKFHLLKTIFLASTSLLTVVIFVGMYSLSRGYKVDNSDPDLTQAVETERQEANTWLRMMYDGDYGRIPSHPSYIQRLQMSFGAFINEQLKIQIGTPGHVCQRMEIEACAMVAEAKNDKELRMPALTGKQFYLTDQPCQPGQGYCRGLHQTQTLAIAEFNRTGYEWAVKPIRLDSNLDPFDVDKQRKILLSARIDRLGLQGFTDAASTINQLKTDLDALEPMKIETETKEPVKSLTPQAHSKPIKPNPTANSSPTSAKPDKQP